MYMIYIFFKAFIWRQENLDVENPVHCPSLEMKFLNKMHFPYQIFQKGEWGDDA